MNLQNLIVNTSGPLLLIVYASSCMHRLNMELDLQSLFGAPCVQLYFLAETPRSPHLGSYTMALLVMVSLDRRHLFVTPLAACL
jgi:hypothetical protein